MQGHDRQNCRKINQVKSIEKPPELDHSQEMQKQQVHTFQRVKARVLSSGKIVGDPGNWNVVRDNRKLVNRDNTLPINVANKFQALNQEEEIQAMVTNGKVEKIIDVEANQKDKDEGNMTSKEWVTKSFGAILPTHDTDQSTSSAKRQVLYQCAQNKEKEGEDKEVSVGEQSARDNYQKDVISGDYEEEDKNSSGNCLGTCGSAKQQGFNKIQELVESRDARDKEKPENQSFMDSTFEIDNNISSGECLHVDENNDENEFKLEHCK
ncbi:hypothetical protein RDI58_001218 [Solanum bulbocastanum]|uniref:Uncharacterized protein n=1 Tax=Solanum bulbocastanum TaxID=147425 RepID=A0AAN8U4Q8_SOLBU